MFSQRQNPGLMKSTCLSLPTWAAQDADSVHVSAPHPWPLPVCLEHCRATTRPGPSPCCGARSCAQRCLELAHRVLGAGAVSRVSSGSLSCCPNLTPGGQSHPRGCWAPGDQSSRKPGQSAECLLCARLCSRPVHTGGAKSGQCLKTRGCHPLAEHEQHLRKWNKINKIRGR